MGSGTRITTAKKLDSINELTEELVAATSSNLNENGAFAKSFLIQNNKDNTTNENIEPRVQIIGANEVYNDPRQRRLSEYNNARLLKPVVIFFIEIF